MVIMRSLTIRMLVATALCLPIAEVDVHTRRSAADVELSRETRAVGQLPTLFVSNLGQADSAAGFMSAGARTPIFFTAYDVRLVLRKDGREGALFLELVGSAGRLEGRSPATSRVSYLGGAASREVAAFHEVAYGNAWPGVDAVFRDNGGTLKYEFLVAPGANVQHIRLRMPGADTLTLDAAGNLHIATPLGPIVDTAPSTYQTIGGRRRSIESRFVLHGEGTVGFAVGEYDPAHPLLIDPSIVYSTLLGGLGEDSGRAIAVDSVGAAYVTGDTRSTDFPTTPGVVDTTPAGETEGFVAKVSPDGRAFEYVTYLGGSGTEYISAIAVDQSGHAYVAGSTTSADFPVTAGAFRSRPGHPTEGDGFVSKLNAHGTALVYSTYLGGNRWTSAAALAVDASGHAHVAGCTEATNLPLTPTAVRHTVVQSEAYLIKFNPPGNGVLYGTYLGGSGFDCAVGLDLDSAGNVYVTGTTTSPDMATTPGAYARQRSGDADGFAIKIAPSAPTPLVYSTYLKGHPRAIAVDPQTQAAYVASYDLTGPLSAPELLKLNSTGSALEYRQRVGPELVHSAIADVTVDAESRVFVGGYADDIHTWGFVSRVDSQGLEASRIEFRRSGGSDDDPTFVLGVATDGTGAVYATGTTGNRNFPLSANAPQRQRRGVTDAFVTKISFADAPLINIAEHRPASSSSHQAGHYAAAMAFDGDFSTRWSSAFSDPQWIAVDLGRRYHIERVALHWETAYGREYELHVSDDGVNWYPLRPAAAEWVPTVRRDGQVDNHVNLSGFGRYVRMFGLARGTQWGYSLWEMQVFGTPTSTPAPPPGTINLARGAAVSVSTIESFALNGQFAVDGKTNTRWSSEFSDPQWISVDLGARVTVSRVVLRWEAAYGRDYRIDVSNGDGKWTTVKTVTNGDGGVDDHTNLSAVGRYVMIYGTRRGTPWGYSLWELEVYGVINDRHSAPPPAPASADIVIRASDAGSSLHGLTLERDATAASGYKVSSSDAGRAWLNSPPAPGDAPHAVFGFTAPEAGSYRMWIRLKAKGDSKWNDSVWVQFTNASRNGTPVYRIGSNDGLLVNLENCSGCGVQGWGWQDNSWWLNQSSLVTLTAGWQQIQIALREDGVEFDQIVLSPSRFLSSAPGALKNDTTIVAR